MVSVITGSHIANMVKGCTLTILQLDEVAASLPFDSYFDGDEYEYSGNFIITTDEQVFDEHYQQMCCGKVREELVLDCGTKVYFGFDYGH